MGLVFFSIPVFVSFGSYHYGLWLPLVVQETAAAFTIAFALVVNYATEGKHKRFIKNAFQQYLSPAVIDMAGYFDVNEKILEDPLTVFEEAMEKVRPRVEVKSRRVGAASAWSQRRSFVGLTTRVTTPTG